MGILIFCLFLLSIGTTLLGWVWAVWLDSSMAAAAAKHKAKGTKPAISDPYSDEWYILYG
jgi:hypothetical protein